MCTAAAYKTTDFYFGRTLDYDFSYGDEVTITPRNYSFEFHNGTTISSHYAMIGMALVAQDYPLYHEAVNEKGLGMAGLNFEGNAYYQEEDENKDNITQFEFIPWILSQCENVQKARKLLCRINLTKKSFSDELPTAQLHWIMADKDECIVIEFVKEGMRVYDNPVGILTNNPTFHEQLFNLNNYMRLSPKNPVNHFSDKLSLQAYSRGMGALGMPGDLSSQSRFVRAAFTKLNTVSKNSDNESVNQFFHILGSVEQQEGCCELENGKYEITLYTSCCNTNKGIYYYTTYDNHQITAVDMHLENLDDTHLKRYASIHGEQIYKQNQH